MHIRLRTVLVSLTRWSLPAAVLAADAPAPPLGAYDKDLPPRVAAPKEITHATLSPLEPGFRWIFNGKNLDGWHKNREKIGHGTGGQWTVENGAITGRQDPPGSGNGGILLTDAQFGDIEVIFEVHPDWGCDSGFFVRSTEKGQCFQVMIDYHDNGNIGEIYREGLDGATNRTYSLQGVHAEDGEPRLKSLKVTPVGKTKPAVTQEDWDKLWKINDWNTIRVRVVGNPPHIKTWLNGREITEYRSDKAFEGTLRDRGHLAVQVHGGKSWPKDAKVQFRNIQVKELKGDEKHDETK